MVGVAAVPVAVYEMVYGSISVEPVLASVIIIAIVFVIELKLAGKQVRSLLQNIGS